MSIMTLSNVWIALHCFIGHRTALVNSEFTHTHTHTQREREREREREGEYSELSRDSMLLSSCTEEDRNTQVRPVDSINKPLCVCVCVCCVVVCVFVCVGVFNLQVDVQNSVMNASGCMMLYRTVTICVFVRAYIRARTHTHTHTHTHTQTHTHVFQGAHV